MLFKPITGAFKESALLVHSSTKVQKYKNSQNTSSSQWKNKKKVSWEGMLESYANRVHREEI